MEPITVAIGAFALYKLLTRPKNAASGAAGAKGGAKPPMRGDAKPTMTIPDVAAPDSLPAYTDEVPTGASAPPPWAQGGGTVFAPPTIQNTTIQNRPSAGSGGSGTVFSPASLITVGRDPGTSPSTPIALPTRTTTVTSTRVSVPTGRR